MERSKFVDEFYKASNQLDKKRIKKLIKRVINSNSKEGEIRGKHDLIIVMEELAELSQKVSKVARGRCDKDGLMEEMADVALSIIYLQDICDVSTLDLYKAINVKIDRIEKVLNEKGKYL